MLSSAAGGKGVTTARAVAAVRKAETGRDPLRQGPCDSGLRLYFCLES